MFLIKAGAMSIRIKINRNFANARKVCPFRSGSILL